MVTFIHLSVFLTLHKANFFEDVVKRFTGWGQGTRPNAGLPYLPSFRASATGSPPLFGDTTQVFLEAIGMRALKIAVFILLLSGFLIGQTNRGGITGTVTDANGAVVPSAKVTITKEVE